MDSISATAGPWQRIQRFNHFAWMFLVLALTGCATSSSTTVKGPGSSDPVRNNAYSLLYDLCDREKDVDKLLLIKAEKDDIGDLLADISEMSKNAKTTLTEAAQADPTLDLTAQALPPGEVKTREHISSSRTRKLVFSRGPRFELQLLLSQAEALSYGSALAQVAQRHEKDTRRRAHLEQIAQRMDRLYERVLQILLQRMEAK